jgi:hypothetical protein
MYDVRVDPNSIPSTSNNVKIDNGDKRPYEYVHLGCTLHKSKSLLFNEEKQDKIISEVYSRTISQSGQG